ncbi:MAG: hypothetical protein AB1730_12245 [Myxococcota bacterium]
MPSPSFARFGALCLSIVALSSCTCGKPPPTTPTLKEKGETCARDEECKSGLCDAIPGFQTVCVTKCADGCASDEICTQLTPGRFSCARDQGGLCRTCTIDADCGPYPADKCVVVDGMNVCARDCTFDQACPTSYRCLSAVGVDGKAKANLCQPASGSCTCTASSAGQTISCENTNGFGTCTGVRTCDGVMGYGACDARTPAAESCNGIDDDCDGTVDEDQPMVTCGVGACEVRLPSCGDGGVLTCTPGTPTTEVCNDIDDDCDGTKDNGFDLASNVMHCGACNSPCMLANATPRCVNRACEVLNCDTGWGNCDGLHPNGCEANLLTDVNNCNACGNRCQAPGATGTCVNGACQYQCATGFYDLDGNPANGCEYACTFTSAVDLPDVNFTDANCDGMDGEVTNGIYVSPVGDDTYAGTMSQPKRSIAAAVAAAIAQNKRDVYVSAGSYSGPVTLSNVTGVNVAGGYAPGTTRWTRSPINSTIVVGGNPALSLTSVNDSLLQFITFRADSATGQESNGNGKSSYGGQVRTSTNLRLELVTLVAGDGSPGAAGTPGTDGAAGGNGGPGLAGCTNDDPSFPYLCNTCTRPSGGGGGFSACGRNGGAGGQPGWRTPGNSGSTGSSGVAGLLSTAAGTGGTAYGGASSGYSTPQPNQAGASGANGASGTNGTAPAPLGTLSVAGYLPPLGGAATSGTHGNGGGGGGGGGGGCIDLVVLGIFQTCWCWTYGSSGGGGGGGGCAGTAGGAGRGGGGSIALMLWNSQVLAQNLSLQSGRGGDGGAGGRGGSGGSGGMGSGSTHDFGNQGYSGIGGRGGNGGAGGHGGHGAGGAGGPSIGLLRNSSSTINTSQVSYSLGSAGNGGASMGAAGPAGTVAQDQTL